MSKIMKRLLGVVLVVSMIMSISVISASAATQYDNGAGIVTYNGKTYSATAKLYLNSNTAYLSTYCPVKTTRGCSYFKVVFYSFTQGLETKTKSNFGTSTGVTGYYNIGNTTSSFSDVSSLSSWSATVKIGTSSEGFATIKLSG